ncbi:hypothetical protein COU56_02100 [Candidatus Pacearchaeota archaeon CG10_big_fil_rev_8_21_14_0_10_31_9]|nr:MAG: hypothetical protein AUJ62_03285 [Candidatus Pacearchaeota archaeon CG1_02_32_21]PIN95106.1 MAG: hypothetical protein COU56_02100 [Candidatus Pacearchaeota archaeon CG10_big_fil_rev_8_21_14_0_10_31_9]PIZ83741.1 MAG: hypothetical protein COX97_00645 [Candidatus Pacearchaeota archaeon CG_4_10_14_0_2_um_filter_05_32_18]
MVKKVTPNEFPIRLFMIVSISIIIISLVFFAYAQETSLKNNFGFTKHGISIIKEYEIKSDNFYSMKVYDYADVSNNSKFKVQIIEFDNESILDFWMEGKINGNSSSVNIDNNFIYISSDKDYAFWRNGNSFIQIIIDNNHQYKNSFKKFSNYEEKDIFPARLIKNYLKKYPSNCGKDNCMSENRNTQDKLTESLNWFENPPLDIKTSSYYTWDKNCPANESGWIQIEKSPSLSNEEIVEIKNHCQEYGVPKGKDGSKISSGLKECGKAIDKYLKDNNIAYNDDSIVLDECLLREHFLNNNVDYSQDMINLIFRERNNKILKKIELIESLKRDIFELKTRNIANSNGKLKLISNTEKIKNNPYWFER